MIHLFHSYILDCIFTLFFFSKPPTLLILYSLFEVLLILATSLLMTSLGFVIISIMLVCSGFRMVMFSDKVAILIFWSC
jgi:hypothetical protein